MWDMQGKNNVKIKGAYNKFIKDDCLYIKNLPYDILYTTTCRTKDGFFVNNRKITVSKDDIVSIGGVVVVSEK